MREISMDALQAAWRADVRGTAAHDVNMFRRRLRLKMAITVTGAVCVGCFAALFFWLAANRHDALIAVAALAFAMSLPVFQMVASKLRRAARVRYDASPASHRAQMRDALALDLAQLWSARMCAVVLAIAAVAGLGVASFGWAPFDATLAPVSVWIITAAGVWAWQRRRRRRLEQDVSQIEALDVAFRDAEA